MKTILNVPAISCHHCEMSIKNAISKIEGIHLVEVDLVHKKVTIDHENNITKASLIDAIDDAGYDVVE